MGRSVAIGLGQNFLQTTDTARRIVKLARVDPGGLCVDLGAGGGIITDAAAAADCRVWAIELDPRLADKLSVKYAKYDGVKVIHQSLIEAELPQERFFLTANPPFNQSTLVVRRWILADNYQGGALITQAEFGRKIAGEFGATKVSLSAAPFLDLAVLDALRPEQFRPRPRVPTAILGAHRRPEPLLPWAERRDYWQFVNFLFERSHPALSDALQPLRLRGLPDRWRNKQVRELAAAEAVDLFDLVKTTGGARRVIAAFNEGLAEQRQLNLGEAPVPRPIAREAQGAGRPRPARDPVGRRPARDPVGRRPPRRGAAR
ncbi:MAG: rRNA adenine N-6-methyltransferase family protein [Angustibacter sp.]